MIATRQRLRDVADTSSFLANCNRKRALIAFGLVAAILVIFGVRAVVTGIGSLITMAPMLIVQLMIAGFYLIFQFGVLFWFLSRPRKYTVTPDDPQIG